MEPEYYMVSEMSQTEKCMCYMFDLTCGNFEHRIVVTRGREVGRRLGEGWIMTITTWTEGTGTSAPWHGWAAALCFLNRQKDRIEGLLQYKPKTRRENGSSP